MRKRIGVIVALIGVCLLALRLAAQADCGVVNAVGAPVDAGFTLVQDYAVANIRHQGRYHTGEDWQGGRGTTTGKPVYAIADGRVTFTSASAWGRDGGVVILEHRLRDSSLVYSLYGHIGDSDSVKLPPRFSCVSVGQAIGVILDVRPAPHVHFEIRTNNGDTPGPGYTRPHPNTLGYIRPSAFLRNATSALHPAHVWQTALPDGVNATPPLRLNDNSLLIADKANALRRILPDGRILWRTRLNATLVGISALQGQSLLTFSDGTMQWVDVENGTLGESWRVPNVALVGTPVFTNGWMLYHTVEGEMVAISANRRDVVWRAKVGETGTFRRVIVANEGVNALVAGVDERGRVAVFSAGGVPLAGASSRYGAFLSESAEKELLLYTWGGVWQIGVSAEWQLWHDNTPRHQGAGAIAERNGALFLHDGKRLSAFGRDKSLQWQTPLPLTMGAELRAYNNTLLLLGDDGTIATLNANTGAICAQLRAYNDGTAPIWHDLGADNRLRIVYSWGVMALDWQKLKGNCP